MGEKVAGGTVREAVIDPTGRIVAKRGAAGA
jgi:hypothetical protein